MGMKSVMCSETVILGLDRSETKKIGFGLACLMLCCETRVSVSLVVIIILKNTATFQVIFYLQFLYSVLET